MAESNFVDYVRQRPRDFPVKGAGRQPHTSLRAALRAVALREDTRSGAGA